MRTATWRALASPKSIASKLILVTTCALLVVLWLAVQAFQFANSSRRTADKVYEEGYLELVTANKLASAIDNHRRIVESAPAEVDRDVLIAERKQLEELNVRIDRLLAESHITKSAPSEPAQSIARDVAMMVHLGMQTNDYASNFAIDMAKESASDYNEHARRVSHHIVDYRALKVTQAEEAFKSLKASATHLIWLATLCFGATLLVIAPLGALVVRSMLQRLRKIHAAINELALGNLAIRVPLAGDHDEIGDLARALIVLHGNARTLVENKSELAERNAELAQLSSTLEERVAERTAVAEEAVWRAEQINDQLLSEIAAKNSIEESLRAANRDLLSATRAKSQFLANVSHEIRTPIMGVLGMSDLLRKGTLGKQQRHFADTIAKSAEILLGIVNDILDLSRMDAGKLTLDSHEFDLDGCIEDVIQVTASSATGKKLGLDAIIAGDVPRRVVGDGVRLRQILLNLVSNAVKFTAAGGVTVRVTREAASDGAPLVAISVQDTGIGISPEQQSRLFNAFSQADPSITRKFGGTGLGLVICKNLVEMMGGSIAIASEAGVGTTMSFRIPLAAAPESAPPAAPPLAGKHVMYVADSALAREGLGHRLARLGATACEWTTAADAVTALAEARVPHADAAIVATANGEADARAILAAAAGAGLAVRVFCVVANQPPEAAAGPIQCLPAPALSREIVAAVTAHPAEPMNRAALVAADAADDSRPSAAPANGPHVLVAEDNPINQEVIAEYLAALGCSATLVDNGESAVHSFDDGDFDIVLLDCQMPRMDGYMAARRMRQVESDLHRARMPIIAITANTFDSDRRKCLASGMDTILSKPFTQEQLARVLKQALGHDVGRGAAPDQRAERSDDASSRPPPPATTAPSKTGAASPLAIDADMAEALALQEIDGDAIAGHKARNPRLLQRMIALYGRHTPANVDELQRALARREWASVKAAAHTLKSSSKSLGVERFAALMTTLEQHGRALADGAEPQPDAAATASIAGIVLREAARAMQALDRHRDPPLRDSA